MKEFWKSIIEIAVLFTTIFILVELGLPNWLYFLGLVIIYAVWILGVMKISNRGAEKIRLDIVKRMTKEGYNCKMEEGHINLIRNERKWQVYVEDTNNPKIKTVLFQDVFTVGDPDDVHYLGSAYLEEAANNNFRVKIRGSEGRYACTYESAIENSDDFMTAYSLAWNAIGEAVEWMANNWGATVQHFPASNTGDSDSDLGHKIGFKQ